MRRRVDVALTGFALIGFGLWIAMWVVLLANPGFFGRFYGQDLAMYLEATRRWLGGEGFYHAYQLRGAYSVSFGDVLYPPPALILLTAFTVVPTLLWWLIPAASSSTRSRGCGPRRGPSPRSSDASGGLTRRTSSCGATRPSGLRRLSLWAPRGRSSPRSER